MTPHTYLKFLTPAHRRKIPAMISLGVVRRLADLVGLATLLPVIVLIVYPGSVEGDEMMAGLFRFLGGDSTVRFGVALGVLALVALPLKSVFTIWLDYVQNRYLISIYTDLSRRMYLYHHRRGVLFIRRNHTSQLAFHINGACLGYATGIVGTIIGGAADAVMALLLTGLAVWLAPWASLAVLGAMVPVMVLWFGVVSGRLKKLGKEAYDARRAQSRLVQESLKGHVSMNVDGTTDEVTAEFERGLADISRADLRSGVFRQIPPLIMQVCAAIILMILLLSGMGGGGSVTTFVLFGFAAVRLMPAVLSLAAGWNTLQNSRYIIDILEEADEPESENAPNESAAMPFERAIEMRNVSFAFEDGAEPVFSDLSLRFAKGESVGIRGESGAGKSTLFNLLLGFYIPQSGGIYIDGVRLSPSTRKNWHAMAGYVEQDVFVRNDTVAKNIASGGSRAAGTSPNSPPSPPDSKRVAQVLHQVGLDSWLAKLPDGLDTILGEGGTTLSGGQRQRLGIARALYKQPAVLFVDEATSALDPAAEEEIVTLLDALTKCGLTLFIISHRASALRHCDRVIEI
jgi:ABC-type multidrug transport system fused ATPase/permease subunit